MRILPAKGAWLLGICTALGCSFGIKDVVPATDAAGSPDAPVETPDAGPGEAPDDFECLNELGQFEPWTQSAKFDPRCDDRKVYLIEDGLFPSSAALSVARTTAGRVGIAYHNPNGFDSGALHVAHFTEPTKSGNSEVTPTIEVIFEGDFTSIGRASDIAAASEGPLHVAYLQDDSGSGTLRYRTVTEDGLSEIEVTGVASTNGELAIAPTGELGGDVHLLYYRPDNSGGEIVWQLRDAMAASDPWSSLLPVPLATDLENDSAKGIGHLSLATDAQEIVHLAFHRKTLGSFASQPKYTRLQSSMWTPTTTIDNAGQSGHVGWSIGLAVAGIRRFALYYDFPVAGAGDLMLATWQEGETVALRVTIRSEVAATFPLERARIAIDKWDQLHLLYFSEEGRTLVYGRYSAAGELLAEDIVARDIPSGEFGENQLGLAVDDSGRPHIVYLNELGELHYATRLDR